MAQLGLNARQRAANQGDFDLICTAHLRRLAREIDGLVFVAAIETSTGMVLHSINRSVDIDVQELSRAVCHMIRCHRLAHATSGSLNPILELKISTRREVHILRPLRREPLVALHMVVEHGQEGAARARDALSHAALALDSRRGVG